MTNRAVSSFRTLGFGDCGMFFEDIGSTASTNISNHDKLRRIESVITSDIDTIRHDRPQNAYNRLSLQNKMTALARVEYVCDEGQPIIYLGEYAGFESTLAPKPYALAVICALAPIAGRMTVIIANDNTISAGAWYPGAPRKIQRAQEMALSLGIPVVYLAECPGLYLPLQEETFAGHDGAGGIFRNQSILMRHGIPQLAAVFGTCIAGGGYLPLICDKIIMTESASICIGGDSLSAFAKSSSGQRIGGPETHVHVSGCADIRVSDDAAALDEVRTIIDRLPSTAIEYHRLAAPINPAYPITDLYDIIPADTAVPFDMKQVLARIADGSQVQFILPDRGCHIIAAIMLIDGLPVVFIGNNSMAGDGLPPSVLYREDILKMRAVTAAARHDALPVIWGVDVAGFDIGPDAEAAGLLAHGAALLDEHASSPKAQHLCLIIRKASGAGYYAMRGLPFCPAITAALPASRIEVMSPETLAATTYNSKISRAQDEASRNRLEEIKSHTIEHQNMAATARAAAIRGDIDLIVPIDDIRQLAVYFARSSYQSQTARPPRRLWSITNLAI